MFCSRSRGLVCVGVLVCVGSLMFVSVFVSVVFETVFV